MGSSNSSSEVHNVAVRHIGRTDGDIYSLLGASTSIKVSSAETLRSFCVCEGIVPPNVGVPLHHHVDVEVFVVLQGTLEVLRKNGEATLTVPVAAGEMALVPSNAPHGFRNASGQDVRLLIIAGPGIEAFFRDAGTERTHRGAAAAPGPEGFARVMEAAKRHGQVFDDPA